LFMEMFVWTSVPSMLSWTCPQCQLRTWQLNDKQHNGSCQQRPLKRKTVSVSLKSSTLRKFALWNFAHKNFYYEAHILHFTR
jgi:hypothetical protein